MEYLKSLFTKKTVPVCHQHPGRIIKVCCSHSCKRQRMICSSQQCSECHRGHELISYSQFSENLIKAEQQMQYLQKIQHAIQDYQQKMQNHLKNLFKQSKKNLLEIIEKKFLNKQFVEARKRYKNKDDYIPYLKNLQMTTASYLYDTVSKAIKQRERNINKIIKHQDIGLDISILPVQNILQIITYSKIDSIKSLLPFKCNLVLKFQASKNKFRIQQLHMVQGIKAPVLIVAQSYKNRIFGGFSPSMFPKNDEYIQDRKGRSFLFSLDERVILPIKDEYRRYSIRGGNCIWFGRGDLVISDECNKGNISWAETGRAYKVPQSFIGRQNQFLGGAWYFRILQFQLYEVQIQKEQIGNNYRFNFQ